MNLITPDSGLLFWMILIFAIVFFILAKFGFPVITGSVRKREAFIADSLRKAEEAGKAYEALEETCRQKLDETAAAQAQILDQARAASLRIMEDARLKAAEQTAAMIERAKEDIAIQKEEALKDLQNVVMDMSIAVSEKILRQSLASTAEQTEQINRWVGQVMSSGADKS